MKHISKRTETCSECLWGDIPHAKPRCKERYKCVVCGEEFPPCSFGDYNSGIPEEQCCGLCWVFLYKSEDTKEGDEEDESK